MQSNFNSIGLKLDIILPIYNPLPDWADEIIRQYDILKSRIGGDYDYRLVIVNDGSSMNLEDGASKIKDTISEAVWITYQDNKGKGYALREGVRSSTADIIMYTDYDFPYTYGSMTSMIDKLTDQNIDAVVGKRDDSYYAHISSRRKRISKYLRSVNRILFNLPTDDTQCGLKAFKGSVKETFMQTSTDRYLIDVEFLKKLSRSQAKVDVQMVRLRENVVLSKITNMRLIQELFSYLKIMIFS